MRQRFASTLRAAAISIGLTLSGALAGAPLAQPAPVDVQMDSYVFYPAEVYVPAGLNTVNL